MTGTVYLLHFVDEHGRSKPYRHARHYCGWALDLEARLRTHRERRGKGSPLIRAVLNAGGDFVVAQTWTADRTFERDLKNRGSAARYCPICKEEGTHR